MFSRILRDLREAAQEKQSDVAKAVFVSPSAISQYEHGRTVPSRSTLEALAKHFNVTTDYLLGVSPNPDLEETMNQVYCDNITISSLLDRCLNIPHAKRHHIVAVIDEFQPVDSNCKTKGSAK